MIKRAAESYILFFPFTKFPNLIEIAVRRCYKNRTDERSNHRLLYYNTIID